MSSCPRNRCGAGPAGSGYCKVPNTAQAKEMDSTLKAMLAAREAQDAKWTSFYTPVEPNPPSPLSVAGVGNSSTTTTSSQGTKSAATSWQRR